MGGRMSVFIELLRQYRDELERHYDSHITDDIRQAMAAKLRCQTEQQGRSSQSDVVRCWH